jgi:DNA-binding transcriptional ArsR family regulator
VSAGAAAAVRPVELGLPETFRALSDPVRCAIVEHLGTRREVTVNELAALFPITLQAVSKHIKVLELAGVVTQRRDGRHRPVSLRAEAITHANAWLDRRSRDLAEQYERLDDLLADLQNGSAS